MRPSRQLISLLVLAVLVLSGCRIGVRTGSPADQPSGPAPSVRPSGSSTPGAQPTGAATDTARWSAMPQTGKPTGPGYAAAVLRTIRTSHSASYDRVVFEFSGNLPGYQVEYRPAITEDPSDRPVALAGHAFLSIGMQGATLDSAFQGGHERYSGPTRITPAYDQLREIASSGDFEAVLSFGLGVDHRAGFRVLVLRQPTRIVVDVATAG